MSHVDLAPADLNPPTQTCSMVPPHDPSGLPRGEYPRPQFARPDWINLNGTWEFDIDHGDSGFERGLVQQPFAGEITVPFAPESTLSGIGNVDFMAAVWYRRRVTLPSSWIGRRVLLHLQAADYDTTIWVNGVEVTRHRGGFTTFSADLTAAIGPDGDAEIVIRCRDPKDVPQARGKQATWYRNTHCNYTRTTGIWQTVWLESVPVVHLRRPKITPDLAGGRFLVSVPLTENLRGGEVRVTARLANAPVALASARTDLDLAPQLVLELPGDAVVPWSPENPTLYQLTIELWDGAGTRVDTVHSYAGLRGVAIDGTIIKINGRPVFQRLVLDQGYWPDGIMTAPSDQALVTDIELAMEAGFNGARLHQKVFEERFLYHADRLGYLVWGEFADWGVSGFGPPGDRQKPGASFITQWIEAVERDFNHPALVGWCPLNETHQELHDRITDLDDVTRGMFLATKLADPTRPVIDASGYSHRVWETDVWDSHNYEQDPARFAEQVGGLERGEPHVNYTSDGKVISVPYRGQPYFVSEFGGIWWEPDSGAGGEDPGDSWGYGVRPADEAEWFARFQGLVDALLDDPNMFGYCYTQLTDVFQEKNGVYLFDRRPKFDVARLRAIQSRRAAIERP